MPIRRLQRKTAGRSASGARGFAPRRWSWRVPASTGRAPTPPWRRRASGPKGVNARHLKQVPGRKTRIADARWLAWLSRAGLLRGSFVAKAKLRELRVIARHPVRETQRSTLGWTRYSGIWACSMLSGWSILSRGNTLSLSNRGRVWEKCRVADRLSDRHARSEDHGPGYRYPKARAVLRLRPP